MAIEIKELRIRVSVGETQDHGAHQSEKVRALEIETLRAEIVRECIGKVLEKIKEKAER